MKLIMELKASFQERNNKSQHQEDFFRKKKFKLPLKEMTKTRSSWTSTQLLLGSCSL
jgi:hypothetical protein